MKRGEVSPKHSSQTGLLFYSLLPRLALLVVALFMFVGASELKAQEDIIQRKRQYPGIVLEYGYGKVLQTNGFVKGDNQAGKPMVNFMSFSLKLLWQNPGYTDWQRIHNIPYYGVGLSVGDLFNPEEIGYPGSLYGILGIPFKRWEKLEIYMELQLGLATHWVIYDPVKNPKNIAIGSDFTSHLNFGFRAFYPVGEKLDLGAGVSFTHFSNGGLERPNYGINQLAPYFDLKYRLAGRPEIPELKAPDPLELKKEIVLTGSYSRYQTITDTLDLHYYTVGGLSTYHLWQHSEALKSGFGVDLNVLTGLNIDPMGYPNPLCWDNFTLGIGYQLEFVFDRLSMVGSLGNYAVHVVYKPFHQFYQRIGIKFYLLKNLYTGVNVRTVNFATAEYLEFNLGYRIWSAKRKNS